MSLVKMCVGGYEVSVTERVAAQAAVLANSEILGVWTATISYRSNQLVAAGRAELVIVADQGLWRVPWADISDFTDDGIRTKQGTFSIRLVSAQNYDVFSWMSTHMCGGLRTTLADESSPYESRSPEWRRSRNLRMTTSLRNSGGKWANALDGRRFNSFSLIGTEDWEDYAGLCINAMQMEAITQVEERLERLEQLLSEILGVMARATHEPSPRKLPAQDAS